MSPQENKNKSAVVIPFFNEKRTINSVVSSSLLYADFVIAVNDGSSDGSESHIEQSDRISILNLDKNSGKGNALKEGFIKSTALGFDYTITLDADLQHDPVLIPRFLDAIRDYDIVIGNRLDNVSRMPLQRIMSNHITSFLLSLKTGYKIKDSQCGFRIFRNSVLLDILPACTGFEAESEMIITAARKNLSIGFINIPAIYGTEESKIRPFRTIISFLKVLLLK